jgi:hypothetical protein
MSTVHDPLSSTSAQGMIGHHLASMADDHPAAQHHDLDALADQAPGPE